MATVTPNYNWPVPLSTDLVKDGADAIKDLGDAIDATVFGLPTGALTLVKTQTIGTAVSSVVVTDAFSTDYDSYKVIINGGVGSTDLQISLKLGASTTGYYRSVSLVAWSGGGTFFNGTANGSVWTFAGAAWDQIIFMDIDIHNPFLTKYTTFNGHYVYRTDGGTSQGFHGVNTSYTDFTLSTSTGTITGGTIQVYGYNK